MLWLYPSTSYSTLPSVDRHYPPVIIIVVSFCTDRFVRIIIIPSSSSWAFAFQSHITLYIYTYIYTRIEEGTGELMGDGGLLTGFAFCRRMEVVHQSVLGFRVRVLGLGLASKSAPFLNLWIFERHILKCVSLLAAWDACLTLTSKLNSSMYYAGRPYL